jgi:hypothetical protein
VLRIKAAEWDLHAATAMTFFKLRNFYFVRFKTDLLRVRRDAILCKAKNIYFDFSRRAATPQATRLKSIVSAGFQ